TLERTDLALALERGPMYTVQLHELTRQSQGFVLRLRLDQSVSAHDFLRLREWTVDYRELTAAQADTLSFRRGLQACRVNEGAILHRLVYEFSHRIEQRLWHILHS